jgi:predicted RNase H-like HicB family nuclease
MQITVLVEPLNGNGYRASSNTPVGLIAEGSTREQALDSLRELIKQRLANGAELTQVEVGPPPEPAWKKFQSDLGMDDPLFKDWQAAVEEYRRQRDVEDGIP